MTRLAAVAATVWLAWGMTPAQGLAFGLLAGTILGLTGLTAHIYKEANR
ncbi:hypothetical protein GCM10025865_00850 [Paraoerskovia sediminicola]|uniref:Uncharacterized protein n=1 Tax=Paraoerskovia sediminicola TaxID=1138587 RepID=A0ABM8FYF4_9CELL|nr:hypothetical protein [Paraoerskovia sediminicola]BDZ40786.1 hypothetical protein GCM10025865_00850 [Paraoerskovia sediminicola]